ncbi:MAG: polysaccharide deacetylase family protein, partial [Rhodothermales bacterium]|nr:polysaccharide deacetylase family protein [Rhodothermales bacterium]
MLRPALLALFLLAGTAADAFGQDAPARAVAVTFDDLPAVAVPAAARCNQEALAAFTASLLGVVTEHAVPAAGFVVEANGACLGADGLAALLARWLDAGAELGNHTYSHPSLDAVTVAEYTADVVRGETVTRGLLEARGQRLRYFRHPMLRSGADAAKKAAVDAFLDERGYTVAPVTLDNSEWIYARAYANAL